MSRESAAAALDVPLESLIAFSTNANKFYKPERREPKGKGKFRVINEPFESLKKIQSKIVQLCFHYVEFAGYLSGGIKDRNYVQSVRRHGKVNTILTEDIKNFFPSIRVSAVDKIWRDFFGFPPEVADLLSGLTTYNDHLPQGAPTSTYLANLVFFDSEPQMVQEFAGLGLNYSRHVDDMNVSAIRPIDDKTMAFIRHRIDTMLETSGCHLNENKHKIQNRSRPCRVHGLLINAGRPTKGKKPIANIRAAIAELEKSVVSHTVGQDEVESMFRKALGRVSELHPYQPTKARPMRLRLNEVKKIASKRWSTFLRLS